MILALDLGSKVGVAQGEGVRAPMLDTWVLPTGELGPFLNAFRVELSDRLLRARPTLVAYEEPFIRTFRGRDGKEHHNAATMKQLYGLSGFTEQICWRNDVPCYAVSISQARKAMCGNGRAKKPEVAPACRARGIAPANDHEADAAAVWLAMLADQHPDRAAQFDPLFIAGARGA